MTTQPFNIDFIIGGTPKSGTTFFHNNLNKHINVCMSSVKEPHFFLQKDNTNPYGQFFTTDDYNNLYQNRENKILGESSTWYFHNSETVINNIKFYGLDPKWIFIYRCPVTRCISDYFYHLHRGNINSNIPIENILLDDSHWIHDANKYSFHLNNYIDNFGKLNILNIIYEEFFYYNNFEINCIFKFLKLDNNLAIEKSKKLIINLTKYPNKEKFLKLYDKTHLFNMPRLLPLRSNLFFSNKKTMIDKNIINRLFAMYDTEIEQFEKIIGKKLECWNQESIIEKIYS